MCEDALAVCDEVYKKVGSLKRTRVFFFFRNPVFFPKTISGSTVNSGHLPPWAMLRSASPVPRHGPTPTLPSGLPVVMGEEREGERERQTEEGKRERETGREGERREGGREKREREGNRREGGREKRARGERERRERAREERAGRGGREGSERRKAKFRSMLNECGLGFLN